MAVKLEAIITEKEENCKELREQLELKDKRNEVSFEHCSTNILFVLRLAFNAMHKLMELK